MPLLLREHPLSDSSSQANKLLFKVYMALPFLWELRACIDWTIESTSLDLFAYLKLEDIYVGLTAVRGDMESASRDETRVLRSLAPLLPQQRRPCSPPEALVPRPVPRGHHSSRAPKASSTGGCQRMPAVEAYACREPGL